MGLQEGSSSLCHHYQYLCVCLPRLITKAAPLRNLKIECRFCAQYVGRRTVLRLASLCKNVGLSRSMPLILHHPNMMKNMHPPNPQLNIDVSWAPSNSKFLCPLRLNKKIVHQACTTFPPHWSILNRGAWGVHCYIYSLNVCSTGARLRASTVLQSAFVSSVQCARTYMRPRMHADLYNRTKVSSHMRTRLSLDILTQKYICMYTASKCAWYPTTPNCLLSQQKSFSCHSVDVATS